MQVSKFASLPFLQPKILDYINKPYKLKNLRIFRKLSKRICNKKEDWNLFEEIQTHKRIYIYTSNFERTLKIQQRMVLPVCYYLYPVAYN